MSQGQAGYSNQKSEVQRYYCPVCCAVHLSFTSHPPFIRQIHHAAQHPVELDRRQADAVEARILLDLKVGAAFTRLQTLILQGRVPQIEAEKSVVSYGQLNSMIPPPYLTTFFKAHVSFQLLASSFKDTLRSRASFPKTSGIFISH